MKDSFYNLSDSPSEMEKNDMWADIENSTRLFKKGPIHLHWRSFIIGNAAAVLFIFASIGLYSTGKNLLESSDKTSNQEKVYEALSSASDQLKTLTPLLIDQASEVNKPSVESMATAIEEIDRLIIELKQDIFINGETPVKRNNLKQLYATKLDFYKDLLLKEEINS